MMSAAQKVGDRGTQGLKMRVTEMDTMSWKGVGRRRAVQTGIVTREGDRGLKQSVQVTARSRFSWTRPKGCSRERIGRALRAGWPSVSILDSVPQNHERLATLKRSVLSLVAQMGTLRSWVGQRLGYGTQWQNWSRTGFPGSSLGNVPFSPFFPMLGAMLPLGVQSVVSRCLVKPPDHTYEEVFVCLC